MKAEVTGYKPEPQNFNNVFARLYFIQNPFRHITFMLSGYYFIQKNLLSINLIRMKRITVFTYTAFFSVIISILLTSCGDLEQQLVLRQDGSGKLETSFDIGELIGMAGGLSGLGMDYDTLSDDSVPDMPDTIIVKDPMQEYIKMITDPNHAIDVDTTISLYSIMPDSVKANNDRPDLVNKMAIRLRSKANSNDLLMGLVMNFDNPGQLKEMVHYLQNLDNASTAAIGPSMSMDANNFLAFDADMKAGWIRVDTIRYEDFAMDMGMSGDSTSSEDMGMMEMMFGNSKLKTIIQVPGDVISCTHSNAILTKDNKVIVEQPFLDVIKGGKYDGFTITFTPQK